MRSTFKNSTRLALTSILSVALCASLGLAQAQARAAQVASVHVSITHKVGDENKLFGSVGTGDIADAFTKAGVPVERHEVRMPAGPIRVAGDFDIDLHFHSDVNIKAKVSIIPE